MSPREPPSFADFLDSLVELPVSALVCLGIATFTWLVGVNVLILLRCRRVGKSWSDFRAAALFRDLSDRELSILALLVLVTLGCGVAFISMVPD